MFIDEKPFNYESFMGILKVTCMHVHVVMRKYPTDIVV
jgi:hypothetical protein